MMSVKVKKLIWDAVYYVTLTSNLNPNKIYMNVASLYVGIHSSASAWTFFLCIVWTFSPLLFERLLNLAMVANSSA